jgi:hypothetical protein
VITKQAIYKKSPKGAEALATRQAGLTPKLRSALIMVDGKRSFGELAPMISVLGDAQVLMTELESAGLVEMVGGAPAPVGNLSSGDTVAPSFDAKTVPAALLGPPTFEGARRFTVRLLSELLGPMGEALCVKIENARDMPDFITAVKRARDIVREVKGATAAAQFIEQIEAHTPGA